MSDTENNWPLIEVVAEYQVPEGVWDPATPDKLHAALESLLPVKKKLRMFKHDMHFTQESFKQSHQTYDRYQLRSRDGRVLVQVNKGLLSVNHLQPYSKWEHFVPTIQAAQEAYRSVVASDLGGIGLQFINRIRFEEERVDIQEQFRFSPQFDGAFIQCGCIATQPWEEAGSVLTRKMDAHGTPEGKLEVILILAAKKSESAWTETYAWFDDAHERLNDLFKASISEDLRRRFKGGT